jgi:RHS repeat-associated protein
MMPAAKHFDPVLGIDIHMIQPPGPVPPIPVPHPFVGMIIDPFDYAPWVGATVKVNGVPRAIAGTMGKCIPPHIPIGGTFVPPLPTNECEMFMGSTTVAMDGDAASYLALPALSCQSIGMPPIPRLWKRGKVKSLVLPTSVVLPVPAGPPVMVGGPPTISLFRVLMKLAMMGLARALKKFLASGLGKRFLAFLNKTKQKMFSWMKPGWIKCVLLKAEPVNIISGEVVYAAQDFELPGRIPFRWVRHYGSHQRRPGLCGVGWETPADARLQFEPDGRVIFIDGNPGGAVFPALPPRDAMVCETVGGAELYHRASDLVVVTGAGLRYHFPHPRGGERELLLDAISDLCGNRITVARDAAGLRAVVFDDGRRIEAECRQGRIVRLTLHHPRESAPIPLVRYEYDRAVNLAAALDALGAAHTYVYERHRLVKHTDRVGLAFYYEYDEEGRCTHTWGDGGLYDYRFDYLDAAGETRVTDSLGAVTVTQYDPDQFPVAQIDPLGQTTTFEHDAVGRTTAVTGPAGARTGYEYGERGQLVKLTAPDGTATTLLHDERGWAVGLVSPSGRTWRWQRDGRGRVVRCTLPSGAAWQFEYDDNGDLATVTDPLGSQTRIEWDPFGSTVAVVDAEGRVTRVERTALGGVALHVSTSGARTAYEYDRKGRVVQAVHPGGGTRRIAYDGTDNVVSMQDENGRRTQWRYTGLGHVAEQLSADGTTIRFEYDTEERVVAVVNELGQAGRFTRDALGRVVRKTDFWGQSWLYEFGPQGRAARCTDPLGRVAEFRHDPCGRLLERKAEGMPPERYVYDPDGRLLEATNEVSTVKFAYHPDGPVVEEVQDGFRLAIEHDANGRPVRRESDYGRVVALRYDRTGGLLSITADGEALLEVEYDAAGVGKRERLLGGLERDETLDARGRILGQHVCRQGRLLLERTYAYDAAGHLVSLTDSLAGAFQLENDHCGYVQRLSGPGGVLQEIARSDSGSTLREVAAAPRTAAGQGVVCEYDAVGQTVRRETPAGKAHLRWDALGRLIEVTNEGGEPVRFAYDALNRRMVKETGGRRVRFRWQGERLFADETPEAGPREFVYWPRSFVPVAALNHRTLHYDTGPAGIPYALLGPSGTVVWSAAPDALAGAGAPQGDAAANPLRMQGQYYDSETGLCYNRFRYYDPLTGRFLSQDPLDLRAGLDPYAYAFNVWEAIDPLGLNTSPFCGDPAKARKFCQWIYSETPVLQELSALDKKAKAGTLAAHEMEEMAQHLLDQEGISIITHPRDEYMKKFNYGKSGPGAVKDGAIHMIDDVFWGPEGPKQVGHELGGMRMADALNCSTDELHSHQVNPRWTLTDTMDSVGGWY